jgi:hypothetical protein
MTFMDSGLRQNGDAFVIAGEARQAQGCGALPLLCPLYLAFLYILTECQKYFGFGLKEKELT